MDLFESLDEARTTARERASGGDHKRYQRLCRKKARARAGIGEEVSGREAQGREGGKDGAKGRATGMAKGKSKARQEEKTGGKAKNKLRKKTVARVPRTPAPTTPLETLFLAERARSMAMELRERKTSRAKQHASGRFRKAFAYAERLVEQTSDPSHGPECHLQAIAYKHDILAMLHLHRGDAGETLPHAALAGHIYHRLALLAKGKDLRKEALANSAFDRLEPVLRFAAYQSNRSTIPQVDLIAQEAAKSDAKVDIDRFLDQLASERTDKAGKASSLEPVVWVGQEVAIRDPKLAQVLLMTQTKVRALETSKASATGRSELFDQIMASLSEANDVVGRLLDDHGATSSFAASRGDGAKRTLLALSSFIKYTLESVALRRNFSLITRLERKLYERERHEKQVRVRRVESKMTRLIKDPARAKYIIVRTGGARQKMRKNARREARVASRYLGLIKLYEGCMTSLNTMIELVQTDESAASVGLTTESLEAKMDYCRAHRTIYLARTYALTGQEREALALEDRAALYARQAALLADESAVWVGPVESGGLDEMQLGKADIRRLEKALGDLGRFLSDRIIRKATPNAQGVAPREPLTADEPPFYDLAFEAVVYPGQEAEVETAVHAMPVDTEAALSPTRSNAPSIPATSADAVAAPPPTAATGFFGGFFRRR